MEETSPVNRKARRAPVGSRAKKSFNFIEQREANLRRVKQADREEEAKEAKAEALRME